VNEIPASTDDLAEVERIVLDRFAALEGEVDQLRGDLASAVQGCRKAVALLYLSLDTLAEAIGADVERGDR
jgi:hypothetical protein